MSTSTSTMEIDAQLSQLLGTLTLDARKVVFASEEPRRTSQTQRIDDAAMSDSDSEDSTYQPSPSPCTSTSTSAPSSSATSPPEQGCAYLQAVSAQIRAGAYATTAGDSYLETIFTHREALFAYPPGHRACAVGFSSLARDLEARSWAARRHSEGEAQEAEWHGYPAVRPDWEGDDEAVAAFRHEAWVIANM